MASPAGVPPIILIADDDDLIRFVVRSALEREGYTVLDVGTGDEAITECATGRVDLLILDAHLPGGGLRATLAELRDNPISKYIPVVVMSGDLSVQLKGAANATYLAKPVDMDDLTESIRRLLASAKPDLK
jgi:CheY-like chemotaxis protein